jgi:hypothetical protein
MDGQFGGLSSELSAAGVNIKIIGREKHVHEIGRYIRTIKERLKCIYNILLFNKIPQVMIAELVSYCNIWLNAFPKPYGISTTLSPQTIITGRHVDYQKQCKIEHGKYVQAHKEHNNTLKPRTIGVIANRERSGHTIIF